MKAPLTQLVAQSKIARTRRVVPSTVIEQKSLFLMTPEEQRSHCSTKQLKNFSTLLLMRSTALKLRIQAIQELLQFCMKCLTSNTSSASESHQQTTDTSLPCTPAAIQLNLLNGFPEFTSPNPIITLIRCKQCPTPHLPRPLLKANS